ncbi:MAG: hypothetical protein ACRDL7_08585 [Gaiellaceae bacterium]
MLIENNAAVRLALVDLLVLLGYAVVTAITSSPAIYHVTHPRSCAATCSTSCSSM